MLFKEHEKDIYKQKPIHHTKDLILTRKLKLILFLFCSWFLYFSLYFQSEIEFKILAYICFVWLSQHNLETFFLWVVYVFVCNRLLSVKVKRMIQADPTFMSTRILLKWIREKNSNFVGLTDCWLLKDQMIQIKRENCFLLSFSVTYFLLFP